MSATRMLMLMALLTVPAVAGDLAVTGTSETAIDLTVRHDIAIRPMYALFRLGGGHQADDTGWQATGATWSPCWRKDIAQATELHMGAGVGLKLGPCLAEVDLTRHWLDGTVTHWSYIEPNPPSILDTEDLEDTWSLGLTALAKVPLGEKVTLLLGGGYRWDLERNQVDLSGPVAMAGLSFRLP